MVGKIALGLASAAAASVAYAARSRSASLFAPSVYHGPRGRRSLALTFDDGPSPSTPALLDLLDKHAVRATFFQCGMHVRRLPEIARWVAEAGHELGNHTDTHASLWLRSASFIDREIGQAQHAIEYAAGVKPVLFRAPYGVRWWGLRHAQETHGLLGVMWTMLGRDWTLPAGAIVERISSGIENGAIICLHDGRERVTVPDISNTISAVREVIPRILDRGFHLATVSELIKHPVE
jgi:peptidoglycan-N-acetylglucosamine deacetylase